MRLVKIHNIKARAGLKYVTIKNKNNDIYVKRTINSIVLQVASIKRQATLVHLNFFFEMEINNIYFDMECNTIQINLFFIIYRNICL